MTEAQFRIIAFYLPQFHQIPENDAWWGKGFTEWTNVKKAQPLFRGHYQPRIPTDLGYYDLLMPEVCQAQAALAREYGLTGFCYWHYWFGDKRLLEQPFNAVLKSGEPNFPFCLAWANESWNGRWYNCPDKILIEQTYSGKQDYAAHFFALLDAFRDKRYLSINGKKIFLVFKPENLPNPNEFTEHWRVLAKNAGLPGLYFIGFGDEQWVPEKYGFDAFVLHLPRFYDTLPDSICKKLFKKSWSQLSKKSFTGPNIYSYKRIIKYTLPKIKSRSLFYPTIIPNWDNTPRCGREGTVVHNSTPELFRKQLKKAMRVVAARESDKRMIFVKSWNEWAEGNYLEPDSQFGKAYLEVIKEAVR